LHDNARPHTAQVTVDSLRLEMLPHPCHPPYSPDLAPTDYHLFGPMKKNAGWTEICLRYEGAMGHSSVACAAADFILCIGIHKLVERWDKCLNKIGGYVET